MPSAVTISSGGAELIGNGYRIVPIEPGTKRPSLSGWPNIKATAETLELWKSQGLGNYGIGILGEETPGVDLDISDEHVLANVLDWCRENIGVDNARVGRAPRTLFTCRTDSPFGKMSSRKFESPDGATHQIEILGKGNQYVAYAVHPDTKQPYAWDGLDPLVMHADMLPTLTPEKAQALIEFFETQVPGDWRPITNASTKTASEHEGNPQKIAPLHRVRSAVETIPNNDLAYDDWIKVMLALWAAAGENKADGFEIFDEWSAKSTKYDLDETARVWDATHEVKHIGAGTLFHLAKQNGWVEPSEDMTGYMDVVEGIDLVDEAANDNGTATKGSRKFFTLGFSEAAEAALIDDAEPLIDGVFGQDAVAVIYGPSNSGKTFLALDMGASVAMGVPWRGRPVSQGAVIYVAAEGGNGARRRFAALQRKRNPLPGIPLRLAPCAVDIFDPKADTPAIIQEAKSICGAYGVAVKLIIIDTLARTMGAGDENKGADMNSYIRNIDRIRSATGATVLIVHHTGKDLQKGARGHSSLLAAIDTEIEIDRRSGSAAGLIKNTKQRDTERFADIRFTLETVNLGLSNRGRTVTSCVVRYLDESEHEPLPLSTTAERLLGALEEHGESASWEDWTVAYYKARNPTWKTGGPPRGCSDQNLRKYRKELTDADRVGTAPDGKLYIK